ncbi:hypothetical protein KKF69_00925, partial [Patescibacteria group bacterium]|nr:hypothetical protein [Patescibacteria group bacterium]
MKKITAAISATAATLIAATPAFAQINLCGNVSAGQKVCSLTSNTFGAAIGSIITTLMIIAVIIAVFFLVWGGIKWIMSGGDKAKVESARNTIIGGIVGLVLVFLAY